MAARNSDAAENDRVRLERLYAAHAKQRQLLDTIPLLSRADVILVLKANPGIIITLTDVDNGTVEIPAFQFEQLGDVRDANGVPLLNKSVTAVIAQQIPGLGAYSVVQDPWLSVYWWDTEMYLDYSLRATQRPFRPMDVVNDPAVLRALVDWQKEGRDEQFG